MNEFPVRAAVYSSVLELLGSAFFCIANAFWVVCFVVDGRPASAAIGISLDGHED